MSREVDPTAVLRVPRLTPGAQRIVEVASELFYRHGLHAVGVDTIAAESGITKRTLYDRFGSKDQLVAVCLQVRHHDWWERMEGRLVREAGAEVLALFDSYVEDADSTDRGCAFINAAAELPADHPAYRVIRAHKRAVLDRLVELLTNHVDDAGDAAAVAQEIYLLLEGAIVHRAIDDDDRLLKRAREATARRVRDLAPSAHSDR